MIKKHISTDETEKECIYNKLTEQGLTSHQTHIGHIGDDFYWSNDPTNSVQAQCTEGR